MGAAAITARLPLLREARRERAEASGLVFDELGGPLVAVCGLVGGAGTSTLALALARQAATASTSPVLVTEADPSLASLAVLAGQATPHPLLELAQRVADDAAPAQTFVELEAGLRLVATRPRRCRPPEVAVLRALLDEARAAHGLVVVDCGTTWTAASPILDAATHTIWSMPATPAGLARARAVLDSDLLPPAGRTAEILVATAHSTKPDVSVRALRRLASDRCERLVLIPHSAAAARGERIADDATARALAGLAPTLRSRR